MQEPGLQSAADQAHRQASTRRGDRIALGSALVGALLAAVLVTARLTASPGETRTNTDVLGSVATDRPAVAQVGAPPSTASPAAAPASPTPIPTSAEVAHVANTAGEGVVLRASPRDDDRTPRGFLEGDTVTVLERRGSDWARVRGDNGQEGWVPSKYLGP